MDDHCGHETARAYLRPDRGGDEMRGSSGDRGWPDTKKERVIRKSLLIANVDSRAFRFLLAFSNHQLTSGAFSSV